MEEAALGLWAGKDASDRIISYYSYLFTFPSQGIMIAAIAAISTAGCALAFTLAWGPAASAHGLLYGLLGLAVPILVSDALAAAIFKGDIFFTQRRFILLSSFSCIGYIALALLSSLAVALTGQTELLVRSIVFAVALNASLRHLVVSVFSTRRFGINLVATFIQPAFCFAASIFLLPITGLRIPALAVVSASVMVGGVQLLLWVVGHWEYDYGKFRIIPLFRAFILAWAEENNGPLEDHITRVGEERDLWVDTLIFADPLGRCRSILVVPYIHPGPFRNVGSSGLPEVLVDHLGEKLGCEVLVAHGISTHERDLTRSAESERVAETVAANLCAGGGVDLASPMVWVESHGAKASCQMFGGFALITLTLSPRSYDDLPEELGDRIIEAAATMGITAAVIDSHNSILHEDELRASDVENLFHAAVEAMRRAKESPRYQFSVGAARVVPSEWGLDEGMGPCGVAALAVRLENDQTCVYVAVDGNNMLSGLRERIIEAIRSLGVDEAEVITSDTHLVNAIGATSRGYYTIGERTDEQKLIEYVLDAVEAALSGTGSCNASHARTVVPGLTVLGEAGLNLLGDVLESAFGLFKRTALVVAPVSLMIGAAVIFLL